MNDWELTQREAGAQPADTSGCATKGEDPRAVLALYISAFFDELRRNGVRDVVISPGSRSTPLAIVAEAGPFATYIDIDERGAAFFALGLAKASGRPVAVISTSGTAPANQYPAVLEAEASRLPLIILSADRPAQLQGLGAPQTCDQLNLFGNHVRSFRHMAPPDATPAGIAFSRQAAREATIAAAGVCDASFGAGGGSLVDAGPVQVNFPLAKPLVPLMDTPGVFTAGRTADNDRELPARIGSWPAIGPNRAADMLRFLAGKKTVIVAGERTFAGGSQLRPVLDLAHLLRAPVLADPLSQLRCSGDPLVVDTYDALARRADMPTPEVVIRFGRWPVSLPAAQALGSCGATQVVVDIRETRDFTSSTDLFIRCTPAGFASALLQAGDDCGYKADEVSTAFTQAWLDAQAKAEQRRATAVAAPDAGELPYVRAIWDTCPEGSLIFSGNSMAIRAFDAVAATGNTWHPMLCNRGLNGIDGTLSTAFGASRYFDCTTVVVGDLTCLHDINAFALNSAFTRRVEQGAQPQRSVVVVCLDNDGGAIFDMLPNVTEQPAFERAFLTPQGVDLSAVVSGFGIPCHRVDSPSAFARAYGEALDEAGISFIHVDVPLRGVKGRYAGF